MEDHKISQPRFVTHESLFWTKLIRESSGQSQARLGQKQRKGQATSLNMWSGPCVPPFPELTTAVTMR